jgi:hypothetical protein
VVDVPYVDLPMIGLTGEWSITVAEQTVAASLVAKIPAAPAPAADVVTRWNIAFTTLLQIRDQVRDSASMLFADRTAAVNGKVEMIAMPFAVTRVIDGCGYYLDMLRTGGVEKQSTVAAYLDRLEPELARLRETLGRGGGRPVGRKGS